MVGQRGGERSSIRRLAIVNRGEPAMRCLAAVGELARESGEPITTIALYTEPDAASWFVREASETVPLGPALVTPADILELVKSRSYYLRANDATRAKVTGNLDWYLHEHLGHAEGDVLLLPYLTQTWRAAKA